MTTNNHQPRIRLQLVAAILCVLVVAALLPTAAHALPPRPTPTATLTPVSPSPPWGAIELHVQSARLELWTVVQWQDRLGVWHDVEGWRGTLDEIVGGVGKKVWWVARADFNKGPFRWAIYQSHGGRLLATSSTFQLPRTDNQTVVVEVSLAH
jgi:hypothetical protein